MLEQILSTDKTVIEFVNLHLSDSKIQIFFNIFTCFGYFSLGWIILFTIISIRKRDRLFWLFWGTSFSAVAIINDLIIKYIVQRERPFTEMAGIILNTIQPSSFSFPSSHAAASGAAFFIFCTLKPKKGMLFALFILSILVSISRIILKVHYPSDVIAGYLSGLLITLFVWKLALRFRTRDVG